MFKLPSWSFFFFFQKIVGAFHPTRTWGPANIEDRRQVDYVPGFIVNPWENMGIRDKNENDMKLLQNV